MRGCGRLTGDVTQFTEGWLAPRLFELTRSVAADCVDDRTWIDLEFERLFSSVDSTLTPLGSQCLYRRLRREPGSARSLRLPVAPRDLDTRNAIRLLEKVGFPAAIIEEARRLADP